MGPGGVEEPVGFNGTRDRQVGAARLHTDIAVVVIGLDHAVHFGDPEDHAIGGGQCAPRERGARAARHDGDVHLVADFQDSGDFGCVRRQYGAKGAGSDKRSARRIHRHAVSEMSEITAS